MFIFEKNDHCSFSDIFARSENESINGEGCGTQSGGQFSCRAERAWRWTRLVYHHPADKSVYARNALRFPIVLERFISSGARASPGGAVIFSCTGCTLSQSADVQIVYSSAEIGAPRPWKRRRALSRVERGAGGCGPGVFINWIKRGDRRERERETQRSVPPRHLSSAPASFANPGRRMLARRSFRLIAYLAREYTACVWTCYCAMMICYERSG